MVYKGIVMKKLLLCLLSVASLTTLSANGSVSATPVKTTLNESEQEIIKMSQTLTEAINCIYHRYYHSLDSNEVREAFSNAIRGFTKLDPHTGFLDKKECQSLQEQMAGEFYGIGIVLPGDKETEEEHVPVIEIVPNGPADKAGLKQGDKIIEIGDTIVKGMTMSEVLAAIKGEKNSKVTIKVIREKYPEPMPIEVQRDVIKSDDMFLMFYLPEQNIYYLMLSVFSEKSVIHARKLLEVAHKKKADGIIIDLRNNTGGLLDAAVDIASLFLPKDSLVVVTKNRENKVTESWKTKKKPLDRPDGMPIFFITNNYTASAAEILAGTLSLYSQHDGEKLNLYVYTIGIDTFGKGSVQEVISLSNHCALRMTTSLYFLPFDTLIQGKGITPDFHIEPRTPPSETVKWMTSRYGRESSLKRSIKPHGHKDEPKKKATKTEPKKSWEEQRQELIAKDYMVQNTVDLIKLLEIGKLAYPEIKKNRTKQLQFLQKNFILDNPLKLEKVAN